MPRLFNLPDARTIRQASRLMSDRSNALLRKARRRVAKPRFAKFAAGLDCLAGRRHPLPDPIGSNGPARKKLAGSIFRAVRTIRHADPEFDVGLVTIIDKTWETSDEHTIVPVAKVQAATRPTLTAMGDGFISTIEVQMFTNIRHPRGGKLLTPHIHALVVGRGIRERAEAVASDHQGRFVSRFPGMAAIDVAWLNTDVSLAHATGYMLKLTPRAKTYYRSPKGRQHDNLHESEKGDRYIRFLRLLQIQSMLDLRRIVYAGGIMRPIRAEGFRTVSAHLRARHVRGECIIPPDGVPHFWIELLATFGEARFELPLILNR